MKINAPNPLRQAASAKDVKRRNAASGDFAGLLDALSSEDDAPAEAVQTATPLNALAGMLSLQEVGGEPARRRAVAYGNSALDVLEEIRHGLLTGTLPISRLQNLSDLLDRYEGITADPNLNTLLEDIRLRAAVELAKLEMARGE